MMHFGSGFSADALAYIVAVSSLQFLERNIRVEEAVEETKATRAVADKIVSYNYLKKDYKGIE